MIWLASSSSSSSLRTRAQIAQPKSTFLVKGVGRHDDAALGTDTHPQRHLALHTTRSTPCGAKPSFASSISLFQCTTRANIYLAASDILQPLRRAFIKNCLLLFRLKSKSIFAFQSGSKFMRVKTVRFDWPLIWSAVSRGWNQIYRGWKDHRIFKPVTKSLQFISFAFFNQKQLIFVSNLPSKENIFRKCREVKNLQNIGKHSIIAIEHIKTWLVD